MSILGHVHSLKSFTVESLLEDSLTQDTLIDDILRLASTAGRIQHARTIYNAENGLWLSGAVMTQQDKHKSHVHFNERFGFIAS